MEGLSDVSLPARSIPAPDDNSGPDGGSDALRAALTRTLRRLREILHRRARLSSRAARPRNSVRRALPGTHDAR